MRTLIVAALGYTMSESSLPSTARAFRSNSGPNRGPETLAGDFARPIIDFAAFCHMRDDGKLSALRGWDAKRDVAECANFGLDVGDGRALALPGLSMSLNRA